MAHSNVYTLMVDECFLLCYSDIPLLVSFRLQSPYSGIICFYGNVMAKSRIIVLALLALDLLLLLLPPLPLLLLLPSVVVDV